MAKYLLLIIVCFVIHPFLFAQNSNSDSLKKALDNYKKDDTVKVKMLYRYAESVRDSQSEIALRFAKEGRLLADKINSPYLKSEGALVSSFIYTLQNRTDTAVSILLEGLNEAEKLHVDGILFKFYYGLGEGYRILHDYKKAEYYDYKALAEATKQKNQNKISRAFEGLINLAAQVHQVNKVDSLISIALPLARELKDSEATAHIEMMRGEVYMASHKYKQAIYSYSTTLAIFKQQHTYHGIAYIYFLLSSIYKEKNSKDSARWYAEAAMTTATKYNLKKESKDAHDALFEYYDHFKDYKNALKEKFILDSFENEKNAGKVSKTTFSAEMRYNQEKKDLLAFIEQGKKDAEAKRIKNTQYLIMTGLGIAMLAVLLIALIQYRNNKQKKKANIVLQKQKQKVESTLDELKSAQAQLIQSEKMASLGELTAGIAHEIQNPLNFVNNFSEVNRELADEAEQEANNGNLEAVKTIIKDIKDNEEKINHHGRRAAAIVKGMLQHSRASSGKKELTDINALCDEYLRLSYHGLRAKDKSFNADFKTGLDNAIGKINIVPQDIGRVLLNLYNNAFYAVSEKKKSTGTDYEPKVSVSTKKTNNKITITVSDNGNGIPQKVVDKIFQPFFTTKPTGQGTGLGLSLSYDIIKAHGGEIKVNTKEKEFTEFVLQLPITV